MMLHIIFAACRLLCYARRLLLAHVHTPAGHSLDSSPPAATHQSGAP